MSLVAIFFTAFGLSMDAFAVSITSGVLNNNYRFKYILKIGFLFGFFQGFMPVIGWLVGLNFRSYISHLDHWIAFSILAFIGIKMVYESLKDNEEDSNIDFSDNKTILFLAIATSIDAMAVGFEFAFLKVSIISSALIIGIVTFLMCSIGVIIGKKSGHLLKRKAELSGGIILTLIGIKILFDHLNINVATLLQLFN